MQISLEKAVEGFVGYMADQVAMIPKALDRFFGYAALGSIKNDPSVLVSKVRPWGEMFGVVSGGNVDTEALKTALTEAFGKVPKFSCFGFTFTANDADALIAKMEALVPNAEGEA